MSAVLARRATADSTASTARRHNTASTSEFILLDALICTDSYCAARTFKPDLTELPALHATSEANSVLADANRRTRILRKVRLNSSWRLSEACISASALILMSVTSVAEVMVALRMDLVCSM